MNFKKIIKLIAISIAASSILIACSDNKKMKVGTIGGSPQVVNIDPTTQECNPLKEECKSVHQPAPTCDESKEECKNVQQPAPNQPAPEESFLTSDECQIDTKKSDDGLKSLFLYILSNDTIADHIKSDASSAIDQGFSLEKANVISEGAKTHLNFGLDTLTNTNEVEFLEVNLEKDKDISQSSFLNFTSNIIDINSSIGIILKTSTNKRYVSVVFRHSLFGTKGVLLEENTKVNCPTYTPIWLSK